MSNVGVDLSVNRKFVFDDASSAADVHPGSGCFTGEALELCRRSEITTGRNLMFVVIERDRDLDVKWSGVFEVATRVIDMQETGALCPG